MYSVVLSSVTVSGLRKMSRMRVLRWGNEPKALQIMPLTGSVRIPQLILIFVIFCDFQAQGTGCNNTSSPGCLLYWSANDFFKVPWSTEEAAPFPGCPQQVGANMVGSCPPFQIIGHSFLGREMSQQPQGHSSSPDGCQLGSPFQTVN